MIYPKNTEEDVQFMLNYLDLQGDEIYEIQPKLPNETKSDFPTFMTARYYLENLADLRGILKKNQIFQLLQLNLHNQFEQYLQHENLNLFDEEVTSKDLELIQVLKQHQIKMEFSDFLEICELVYPRSYSLASKPPNTTHTPYTIQIVASIQPRKNSLNGLTSEMWNQLKTTQIKFNVQPSNFNIQKEENYILIATGSGIAPMRSFLQQKHSSKSHWGNFSLYYGSKNASDQLFSQEFHTYLQNQTLQRYQVTHSENKHYIQSKLLEDQDFIFQFLTTSPQNKVFICGSTQMINQTIDTIGKILIKKKNLPSYKQYGETHQLKKNLQIVVDQWK